MECHENDEIQVENVRVWNRNTNFNLLSSSSDADPLYAWIHLSNCEFQIYLGYLLIAMSL